MFATSELNDARFAERKRAPLVLSLGFVLPLLVLLSRCREYRRVGLGVNEHFMCGMPSYHCHLLGSIEAGVEQKYFIFCIEAVEAVATGHLVFVSKGVTSETQARRFSP